MPIEQPVSPPIRIRVTDDLCPPGGQPFNPDHCSTAADMRTRLTVVERDLGAMKTAFVLDDLGRPDYDTHRKAQLATAEAAKIVEGYKITATTKIIGAVAAFVVLLLSTGLTTKFGEWFK